MFEEIIGVRRVFFFSLAFIYLSVHFVWRCFKFLKNDSSLSLSNKDQINILNGYDNSIIIIVCLFRSFIPFEIKDLSLINKLFTKDL